MVDPLPLEPIVNKVFVKGEEFPTLVDIDKALILAIQELTNKIEGLRQSLL